MLVKRFCIFWSLINFFSVTYSNAQSDSLNHYFKKAYSLVENANYPEALLELEKILAIDSNDIWALEEQVYIYSIQKNYPEAIKDCNHLLQLEPENAMRWSDAGWFLMLNKEYYEAEKFCLKALKLNNCCYSIYLNLGHLYGFLKQPKQLEFYYHKASNYIPNRETVEKNILPDFDFLKSLGYFPYKTEPYKKMFIDYFNTEYVKKKYGSEILDSIYQLVCFKNYSAQSEVVIELKERFLKVELKNEHLRLFVLSDFFYDLGWMHYFEGNKSFAIKDYLMNAISISQDINDTARIIDVLYQLGNAEEEGEFLLEQALDLAILSRNSEKQFIINLILGDKMSGRKKLDSALNYYRQCFNLAEITIDYETLALSIDRLMITFSHLDLLDSVQHYYNIQRSINGVLGTDPLRDYPNDLIYYKILSELAPEEAISVGKAFIKTYQSELELNISDLYEILGLTYKKTSQFDSAELYFKKATILYVVYMKNNPNLNLDFPLKARNISYLNLKRIALNKKNNEELFYLSEQTKANILYPKLTGHPYPAESVSLETVKKNLKNDELALSFSTSGLINEAYGICISKGGTVLEKENLTLLDSLLAVHKEISWDKYIPKFDALTLLEAKQIMSLELAIVIAQNLESLMGGQDTRGAKTVNADKKKDRTAELAAFNDILYRIYIKPFEQRMVGIKTIYISTDLLTSLIPFESIKNAKGEYLGSLYNIVYVPSFTVKELLKSKTNNENLQMLALGNARYEYFDITNNGGRSKALTEYGLGSWSDLPGTEKELNAIKTIVTNATIMDGFNLSESKLKSLSTSGQLARYKHLHFAVHGMGSTNDYTYNSLIISEKKNSKEDGFLQYEEITKLDLNADLVCLSACQTMVGLPSESEEARNLSVAFLLAGAHSVVATWWKIDDEATRIFMTSFYNLVFEKNKSYSEALMLTRQKFISGEFGEKYREPYYWAAFKYIGN